MLHLYMAQPNRLLFVLFLITCLFPWISLGMNSMDTQPWALIFSAFYLMLILTFYKISLAAFMVIPAGLLIIIFSVFTSLLYYDTFSLGFSFLRGVSSYLTFAFVFVAYYFACKKYGFQKNVFFTANLIWLFVGVVQIVIDPYFFEFLVNVRTSVSRGVTGLSPEPTFYAFFLFFLNFIYLIQFNYKLNGFVKKIFIANIVFIFLVAQSSSVILLLFVGALFVLFYRANIRVLLSLLVVLMLFIFTMDYFLPNSRLFSILTLLYEGGPWYLLSIDESVFARIMSIVYPYYWGIQNYLIPGGFDSIGSLPPIQFTVSDYSYLYDVQSKIMSYFGSVFYELGVFSLLVLFFFFKCIYDKTFRSILEFLYLFFCLQFALTIAFPLIPILLVTFYFRKNLI